MNRDPAERFGEGRPSLGDGSFEEFLEFVETYHLRKLHRAFPLCFFFRTVLEAVDRRGGQLPIDALAHLTGTGVHEGAFAMMVAWLNDHGLPLTGAGDALYLHPVGRDFLEGFRAFGTCPERWVELAAKFGCEEVLVDD